MLSLVVNLLWVVEKIVGLGFVWIELIVVETEN